MDKENGTMNTIFLLINMQRNPNNLSRYINVHSMSLECNCFMYQMKGF